MKIPFNKPFLVGKELYYIAQAVINNQHSSGNGVFTRKCQKLLEKEMNAKKILLTTSCTSALEMAAILCDIGQGDEVIVPSFTFVTTANAFYQRGARPVFAEIRPDTLNMDEAKLEALITERTKAIVPVHYAGIGCEMDAIMRLAEKHGLYVIEDAAQAVSAKYSDKHLGTIGDIGTFSFHETKNYICGEGGAIAINNEKFIERAEIIWEKGTNRSKFFRGEVDKYTWVDAGSSYLPSDILAAFLYAQLEHMEEINKRRQFIFDYYYSRLYPLEKAGLITCPVLAPEHLNSNNHMFYILLKDEETRNDLIAYLKTREVHAVFHYQALHQSPVGKSLGIYNLPVTDSVCDRILRLPFYYMLSREEQNVVIDEVTNFLEASKLKSVSVA